MEQDGARPASPVGDSRPHQPRVRTEVVKKVLPHAVQRFATKSPAAELLGYEHRVVARGGRRHADLADQFPHGRRVQPVRAVSLPGVIQQFPMLFVAADDLRLDERPEPVEYLVNGRRKSEAQVGVGIHVSSSSRRGGTLLTSAPLEPAASWSARGAVGLANAAQDRDHSREAFHGKAAR